MSSRKDKSTIFSSTETNPIKKSIMGQ